MNQPNCYTVYRHIAPNGKMYVGVTKKKPTQRWQKGKGYEGNTHFSHAIKKYGWENIKHEILLEGLTQEQASLAERIFIGYWDLTNPNKGYNNEGGGYKDIEVSNITRKRLSEACSGKKNGMYGKRHSEESKRKMSESKIGTQAGENNPMYGKKHTDETKHKMRAIKLGKKLSPEQRRRMSEGHKTVKVDMIDRDTGKLLRSFNSIKEASRTTGTNYSTLINCCRGIYKTAGGYVWKYSEKNHTKQIVVDEVEIK